MIFHRSILESRKAKLFFFFALLLFDFPSFSCFTFHTESAILFSTNRHNQTWSIKDSADGHYQSLSTLEWMAFFIWTDSLLCAGVYACVCVCPSSMISSTSSVYLYLSVWFGWYQFSLMIVFSYLCLSINYQYIYRLDLINIDRPVILCRPDCFEI